MEPRNAQSTALVPHHGCWGTAVARRGLEAVGLSPVTSRLSAITGFRKNIISRVNWAMKTKPSMMTSSNFTTKGTYFKAGFDYNLYENWLDMENMVYIGARYGVSSFSQTLNSYTIYNRYPYFGPSQEIVSGEKIHRIICAMD